ncbi:MAG: pitrilysin family protein [Saprospiraceae bacterium]
MVDYKKYTLTNGLRIVVHEDKSTPMVAVNLLYNVGSRDELPEKTGFAHLFEHLMFGGSKNAPNFDDVIQNAGGECNAFTNNDLTNFYNILPAENLEVALWLEADRMANLKISQRALSVQRKVVLEEFKETCLNEPYGDVWHHLSDLAYKVHPYRWPTIGKVPKHVEDASIEDVKEFYQKFYRPNNAILVVAGNISGEEVFNISNKYFGNIPAGSMFKRRLPKEPPQKKLAQKIQKGRVPIDALYLAFHAPARYEEDYYAVDLLSDVLSNGQSSRLYRNLLKEKGLVTTIDCYITGSIDPGLFIIEAKPADGVKLEEVEQAIWEEINILKNHQIDDWELQKLKNKIESNLVFSEMNVLNKAINLAFFELIDEIELINSEGEKYQALKASDIQKAAKNFLNLENCSTLYYQNEKTVFQ